jgi:tetratricopeptide (TPR) repeat protein
MIIRIKFFTMKKYLVYISILLLFIIATGIFMLNYNKTLKHKAENAYALQQRSGPSASMPEWASVQSRGAVLLGAIRTNPTDIKSKLSLAELYIKEARVTGNYHYYNEAAMAYIREVLEQDPVNFTALIYKSLIQLSDHHFADALVTAEKAKQLNPYNAFVYGILVDGHVEMGNYAKAVECSDKMISIRPDIRSYSRISYLREIHGDYPGAIEAMQMAVDAGVPGDEATAWARVHLGKLYEYTGQLKHARMHYTITLNERPGYAYALSGLGRMSMANGEYPQAISLFQQADSLLDGHSFKEELSSAYALAGQPQKAASLMKEAIASLNEAGADHHHHADLELAKAYLKAHAFDKAYHHAMEEYHHRPGNIEVNETLAWALYSKGDYASALPYIKSALKTNSKNPELLCRAGLIHAKTGDMAGAVAFIKEGLKNDTNIDLELKAESEDVLKKGAYVAKAGG